MSQNQNIWEVSFRNLLFLFFLKRRKKKKKTDDFPERGLQQDLRGYYRAVSRVDYAVGTVVNALKRANVLQNTLLIFSKTKTKKIVLINKNVSSYE